MQTSVHKLCSIRSLLAACFVATLALSGATQPVDQVIKEGDESVKGTVQSVSLSEVVIRTRDGSDRTIKQSDVKRIIYGDTTTALGEARRALSEKRYRVAVQQGKRALKQIETGEVRALHRPRVVDFITSALFRQGTFDKAISMIEEQRNKRLNHPRFYSLARTYILSTVYSARQDKATSDDYDLVIDRISSMNERAGRYKASDRMRARLKLLGAEAREEFGKFKPARSNYDDLRGSDYESVARLANAGYLRCAVRMEERLTATVQAYRRLLDGKYKNDSMIRSGYLNAKGQKLKTEAQEDDGAPKKLRKALFLFLEAAVLSPTDPSDPTLQKRQSILNAAETYRALAENGPASGRAFFRKQARKSFTELVKIYPRTPESIRAKRYIQN